MNTKRYAFMIAAATGCMQAHVDPFEAMHNSMLSMQKEMVNMFDNMNKMHEQAYSSFSQVSSPSDQGINITVNDQEEKDALQVTITGIEAEQFDAHFNDKELTIQAPHATIELTIHHNILGANITQEIKEESKDEKKAHASFFSSSSHVQQQIARSIDLEKASIEYNKDSKSLIVEIPYKNSKKQVKSIPVKVK